jgi:hypothetical protein
MLKSVRIRLYIENPKIGPVGTIPELRSGRYVRVIYIPEPEGDVNRVKKVLAHYDEQLRDEALREDEAGFASLHRPRQ